MSHPIAAVVRVDRDAEFDLTVWLLLVMRLDDDVDDISWISKLKMF